VADWLSTRPIQHQVQEMVNGLRILTGPQSNIFCNSINHHNCRVGKEQSILI